MKKCLILLPLLGFQLSLHAQSKWSAGYRLGLVYEEAFRNSSNAATNISNQVFVGYRILKRLELEAGLQHNQTRYSNGGTDEMFRIRPDYTFSNFKAQVFRLSLGAKFYFINHGRTSVYALAGLSGCMITGHYEDKAGGPGGELLIRKADIPTQIKPLASIFAGFGVNYQICPKVKLNAQVYGQASNVDINIEGNGAYLYNPNLNTQLGISYSL